MFVPLAPNFFRISGSGTTRSRIKVYGLRWPVRLRMTWSNNIGTGDQLSSTELHCMNVVKKSDYENFLCSLFIRDNQLRRTAFALRAFNVELSQIRDTTQSDQLAQIRFQFWSDLVDQIYAKPQSQNENEIAAKFRNFPLAFELYQVLSGCNLSKHWLLKLINKRRDIRYLSDFPFQTLDELEKYGDSTVVSLYYLLNEKAISLKESGTTSDAGYRISLDHIASHLGKAQWLTNVLRGVIHNARNRRCYIPNDLLVQHRCSHEDFLQLNPSQPVRDACFDIASRAHVHLEHCGKLLFESRPAIQKNDRTLFLPRIPLQDYLNQLQRYNFNIFEPRLHQRNGLLPWKLWWAK